MRATPQGAGVEWEVLVDRHTPVVCVDMIVTREAKTSDMPTRSGMFSSFPVVGGGRLVLVALVKSGCSSHSRRRARACRGFGASWAGVGGWASRSIRAEDLGRHMGAVARGGEQPTL